MGGMRGARHPYPGALSARLGRGVAGHHQAGPPGQGDRRLPGIRSGTRRGHRRLKIRKQQPVEEYLNRRNVMPTCSAAAPAVEAIARPQAAADRTFAKYGLLDQEANGCKPLQSRPIRLFVGQPHRFVAHLRPVYVDRLPPCNKQCPAGRHPGLAVPRRGRRLRKRLAAPDQTTPSRRSWDASAIHSCEGAPATAASLTNRSASIRSSASLGDEALKRGWN